MIKLPRKKRIVRRPKFADECWTGPEPANGVVITDPSDIVYTKALSWYYYYFDVEKAKEWLLQHMHANNYDVETIKAVKSAPSWRVPTTIGWQAKLLQKGWVLPKESLDYLESRITEAAKYGEKEPSVTKEGKKVVNLAERTQNRANQLLAMVDMEIDSLLVNPQHTFSLYGFLTSQKASPLAANLILSKATGWLSDLESKEGYEKLGKDTYKKWLAFHKQLVIDAERYLGNKKRAGRVKKEPTLEKQLEKFVFQKDFPPLKIVSINPADVVGCQHLWVYNTKTRKLTQYNAVGPAGIKINRASLTGWDVETSVTKTLRKPDATLQELLKAGKVGLRKFVSEIKTNDTKPTGRINNTSILLRVIK